MEKLVGIICHLKEIEIASKCELFWGFPALDGKYYSAEGKIREFN